MKSSIESTDINHFNDSDVGQSKSTNVSKFRGTTASQQITIENLQIEKKHLQAALSKQSASLAVPQSKEFSIYDIKDNSTARSSVSEASYDNVPLCDRSQIGLEAQVEKLRELLSRGKENQDTLLDDLNRSKRLNKHLRSTIKCLEKSSAEAEAEKKAIQNKYQKQLLTVKRNTSRRATSTGLTPRDQVVKKRGEENGTRQGDSDKDKVVVPCLTTSGRKASSAEHSATITEPKIESSRLTEHVIIPTQLVPDTRSSRDITEEEKNQILALKLSPSGLSENVVNKGIDEDQDQDQDHDYDPDQREDIFAITEGPCKSCTLYVNSLQQKLQRQKRIHEREIRGLRSVSASPMNSARSEKNGHFFPSVPTTPAASYRCDRRTTGFTLGAVDVPAVTVVPISTVVTSAMCLTSNATSADDVTTSTANNCSLKENVVNFDDHRVGISTSTSIATEQIIGADNLTSSFLSQPTDSTTTKVATDMIAAAVNTAKGRVTFAVSVAASPPPQTPRRTSLRPARLTLSPQIPTSPKGSKPSNGSSSRVIKLKEEVIEPI